MKGKDLLEGLSFVDEEMVHEAEQSYPKSKRASFRWMLPIAASLAIIVVSAFLWGNTKTTHPKPLIKQGKEYVISYNQVGSTAEAKLCIEGHLWERLSTKQAEKIVPLIAQTYKVSGMVNYSSANGTAKLYNIDAEIAAEDNKNVKLTISPNEVVKCYVIEGKSTLSEIEGVKVEAGIFKGSKESIGKRSYIYYADFKIDDVAYYMEFAGSKEDEEFFTNMVVDVILGGKAELAGFDNPVIANLEDDNE